MSYGTKTFCVYDGYIFISNISNDSFVGTINDDGITPILSKRFLWISSFDAQNARPILYDSKTNTLYKLSGNRAESMTVELQDEKSIEMVFASENRILMRIASDDRKEFSYYLISQNALDGWQ